jgi:hypothetical protein
VFNDQVESGVFGRLGYNVGFPDSGRAFDKYGGTIFEADFQEL